MNDVAQHLEVARRYHHRSRARSRDIGTRSGTPQGGDRPREPADRDHPSRPLSWRRPRLLAAGGHRPYRSDHTGFTTGASAAGRGRADFVQVTTETVINAKDQGVNARIVYSAV